MKEFFRRLGDTLLLPLTWSVTMVLLLRDRYNRLFRPEKIRDE